VVVALVSLGRSKEEEGRARASSLGAKRAVFARQASADVRSKLRSQRVHEEVGRGLEACLDAKRPRAAIGRPGPYVNGWHALSPEAVVDRLLRSWHGVDPPSSARLWADAQNRAAHLMPHRESACPLRAPDQLGPIGGAYVRPMRRTVKSHWGRGPANASLKIRTSDGARRFAEPPVTFFAMHRMKLSSVAASVAASALLGSCTGGEIPVRLQSEGALAVAGAQLHYWVAGSGPPVVILHGGPGIGAAYLLSELDAPGFPPDGLQWVAYDQRGSGRSTGAEDLSQITMDRFVEDLEVVRQATGQERMALFGHAFGGLLALHYAIRYPEHVAAMILLDPDPASRELWAQHDSIIEARLTDEDRMIMTAISSGENWEADPVTAENYYLARFQAYFGRREAAVRLRLGLAQGVYGNFPKTALAMQASLGDWDIFDELAGLDVRTLIVTGDQSVFPLAAHERLAAVLSRSELVVLPGVGHFPQMEAPDVFAEVASRFLNEVTENRGGGGDA
jgi:proline iminopeptidase